MFSKNSAFFSVAKGTLLCGLLAFSAVSQAQVAITSINSTYLPATSGTTYSSPGAPGSSLTGQTFTYHFGTESGTTRNILDLNSFGVGASKYAYRNVTGAVVKIRRHNNATITGMRQLLWYGTDSTGSGSSLYLNQPYQENMEIAFNGAKGLNAGTDNFFANTGDGNGNNNNIERFDFIVPAGMTIGTASQEGFIVLDRGVLNAHDAFCATVITSVDADGTPLTYTNVIRTTAAAYGTVNPVSSLVSRVLRKDDSESIMKISATTDATQGIGGVFIRYSDLGLTDGTTVYGYSLMGIDFPASAASSNVVDWTNTTFFPTNTNATNGGLDMVAISGIFELSDRIAPLAYDETTSSVCNSDGNAELVRLHAASQNPGGSIASYTIVTPPSNSEGVLYYDNGTAYVPVTAGLTLTIMQAAALSFTPANNYVGDASFTYYATDNYALVSNTATCTIPVLKSPAAGFSISPSATQELTGNSFTFSATDISPSYTYSYFMGDTTTETSGNPATHSYTAAGTYIVILTTSDTNSCVTRTYNSLTVLSDSVSGGGGGGLESESLAGMVSRFDFNNAKNSVEKHVDYTSMAPYKSAGAAYRTTQSTGRLQRLLPSSLNAGTSSYENTPSEVTAVTKAVDVFALDYVSSNRAKAVALGVTTLGKTYAHTKSVCDRFRGSTLLGTSEVEIRGFKFIRFAMRTTKGDVEYCIAFDAGKSTGRNTFNLQSKWLISEYTGDDSVFNFQAWAADPANAEVLTGKILDNLTAIMPLQQTDTAFKLPPAYIASGIRNKGSLDIAVTNGTPITSAEIRFDERVNENADVDNISKTLSLTPGTDNKISIPINDGYEYTGYLYLNGELVDGVYMADGNWSLDYDHNYTSLNNYECTNNPNRVYADNEYPVYRGVALQTTSADYLMAYKYIAAGDMAVDLSAYRSLKFNAQGTGKVKVMLLKEGVAKWASQYYTTIILDPNGKNYDLSFDDFVSDIQKDAFKANDITAVVFAWDFGGAETKLDFKADDLSFSPTGVQSIRLLQSKVVTASPNPNNGTFNLKFQSEVNTDLEMKVTDITGRILYTQTIAAVTGANNVQVTLPATIQRPSMVMVSLGSKQAGYNMMKITLTQ